MTTYLFTQDTAKAECGRQSRRYGELSNSSFEAFWLNLYEVNWLRGYLSGATGIDAFPLVDTIALCRRYLALFLAKWRLFVDHKNRVQSAFLFQGLWLLL